METKHCGYIRMAEVRRHTNADSLWFVVHDNVYNVTPFLDQHPGGAEALMENAGQDATQSFEDVGHSDDAREDMKRYKVGELHPEDRAIEDTSATLVDLVKMGLAALTVALIVGFVLKRYIL